MSVSLQATGWRQQLNVNMMSCDYRRLIGITITVNGEWRLIFIGAMLLTLLEILLEISLALKN